MLDGQAITVLGGGVAGLAAAVALGRRGARVTVLEQADAITEVGAGIQISPNGAAVLRALGLGAALERAGLRAGGIVLRNGADDRAVTALDMSGGGAGPGYWFVHRADLIALLEAAARDAGVRVQLMQRVTRVAAADERGATGMCIDTAQGAQRRTGLLVGADGLHSVARHALGTVPPARFTGQVAWRAVIAHEAPETAAAGAAGVPGPVAELHMGPGCHLVSYPLRGGRWRNIVAVQARRSWAEEGWHHRDDPANLRAAFAGFAPRVQGWLARVERVNLWGLFRHPVAHAWHDGGRLAILGDAAHPTLPFMAQGANMALEDAWVLAQALDTHADPAVALAEFQALRRPRVERVVATAERNARIYHLRAPLRPLAHAAMRLGGRIAPQAPLRRFDWIYRHDVTATGTAGPARR